MVQVVQVVRMISPGDMHSGNIWFLWSKPSNYQEKLRCHAHDIGTNVRTEESGKPGGPGGPDGQSGQDH